MRRSFAVAAILVAALSGCGVNSGQAATSARFNITQTTVDAELRTLLQETEQPPGAPPSGLALATTQRLVTDALFASKAEDLGITLTGAEVEDARADFAEQYGGDGQLVEAAGQAGIPAGSLNAYVRTSLLFTRIGQALLADAEPTQQQDAARQEMQRYSEEIEVSVAPRYGSWQPQALQIDPTSPLVATAG
jgi:hypothetical protein